MRMIFLIAVIVLAGCKQKSEPEEAGVTSIDTLLQDQEVKDRSVRCGPLSTTVKEKLASSVDFKKAWERPFQLQVEEPMTEEDAKRLLVTIPEFVYNIVFKKAKVSFLRNAETACEKGLKDNNRWTKQSAAQLADLRACWFRPSNQPVQLILSADWVTASRGLLPLVGYAFMGSFDGRHIRALAAEGKITDAQKNQALIARSEFKAELATLGRALITDLGDSSLESKNDLIQLYTGRYRLHNDSDLRYRQFGAVVFAETLDSYYCSPASQASLVDPQGIFKSSWQAFRPIAELLGKSWM